MKIYTCQNLECGKSYKGILPAPICPYCTVIITVRPSAHRKPTAYKKYLRGKVK